MAFSSLGAGFRLSREPGRRPDRRGRGGDRPKPLEAGPRPGACRPPTSSDRGERGGPGASEWNRTHASNLGSARCSSGPSSDGAAGPGATPTSWRRFTAQASGVGRGGRPGQSPRDQRCAGRRRQGTWCRHGGSPLAREPGSSRAPARFVTADGSRCARALRANAPDTASPTGASLQLRQRQREDISRSRVPAIAGNGGLP